MANRKWEPEPSDAPDNETQGCVIMLKSSDDESKCLKTLNTWRDMPPRHYMLKIESFSSLMRILKKNRLDSYESMEFEASGYSCKLVLYPGVEEGKYGSDQISLKLKFTGRWCNAFPIFFLYDQLRDKYLSIQGMEPRRFSETEEWGVYLLVPLRYFKNSSNGYLINDSCVFGVEVFVSRNLYQRACFQTLTEQSKKVYIWNVEKLSELKETGHFSEPFVVGGYQWKFHLYNKGIPKVRGKFMSIFLCLHDHPEFPLGWKVHVDFKLAIINENKSENIVKKGNAWFSDSDDAWGFPNFIKLSDLRPWRGFVSRGAMQIELQIISISMTESL